MSKIVVIGDVMLDIAISGAVTRIAPEAPIGIITEVTRKETLGGAGNVYANLIGAGCNPYFITVVGDDDESIKIMNKVKNGTVYVDKNRKTITKTRIYAYTNHIRKETLITRIDRESTIKFIDFSKLINSEAYTKIHKADFILFSDYKKGLITSELINYIRKINPTAKFIGDTKRLDDIYKGFYIVTPNEFEIQNSINGKIENILVEYKEVLDINYPIITMGNKGIIFIDEKENIKTLPTTAHKAVDVLGAGDTFVAYLTGELSKDKSITDAVYVAIKAAGISVTKEGAYIVDKDEL